MFHPYPKLAHYRHTPNSSSFATRTCLPLRKENEWLYFLSLFYSSSMCFDSVSNLKWSKRLHLICLRCIRKRCSGSENGQLLRLSDAALQKWQGCCDGSDGNESQASGRVQVYARKWDDLPKQARDQIKKEDYRAI